MFYDRSKYIDTRFHYIQDCIINKEIEVKYVKIQDQVANIFTKPLKHDIFVKMRDILRVIRNQV
jgi:hypothetical protein